MQGAVQLVGSSFLSVKIGECAPDMGLVSFVRQKKQQRQVIRFVSRAWYNSCAGLMGVY